MLSTQGKTYGAWFHLKRISGKENESEFTNQAKAEKLNVEARLREKTEKKKHNGINRKAKARTVI